MLTKAAFIWWKTATTLKKNIIYNNCFQFGYFKIVAEFSALFLQSSVSHDPSE